MMKLQLNWRKPLFYLLVPVFFVMVFLGFPPPIAPPLATKARQEESVKLEQQAKRMEL